MDSAEIELFMLDQQIRVLEGSANVIPNRVMVGEEYYTNAVKILKHVQSEVDGLFLFY